jgi:hypothetical protein
MLNIQYNDTGELVVQMLNVLTFSPMWETLT